MYGCCPGRKPATAWMCRPAVRGWLGAMYIRLNRMGLVPFIADSSNPTKFIEVADAVVVLALILLFYL